MGQNKRWKRKAKKIMGECYKGCQWCLFSDTGAYEREYTCDLDFESEDDCKHIREVRKTVKGNNFIDMFGDKLV